MSDAPSPETAPANLPAPLLASGRIGGIVALAVFVLVLGAIGVVGGIVALVRGRRA